MKKTQSEINREAGKHQVEEQRAGILKAAEELFLSNGLENTKMVEIASRAGITKVTLYRYFPNRDAIAAEIQAGMINKIASTAEIEELELTLESAKKLIGCMIQDFELLRDAYRYMGMFDSLYMDKPPDAGLPQLTKDRLLSIFWSKPSLKEMKKQLPLNNQLIMVLSTVIWFLEKLALRGELTWSDQSIPIEEHLSLFEEMILGYIDQLIHTEEAGS